MGRLKTVCIVARRYVPEMVAALADADTASCGGQNSVRVR